MEKKNFEVMAEYNDKKIKFDENSPIQHAYVRYTIHVAADDMKQAYDEALRYLPTGASISVIEEEISRPHIAPRY